MKKLFLVLLYTLTFAVHSAEVIPVNQIEDCFLCSSEPSLTMYWKGQDSKAVVIIVPGGDGYLGLKRTQTDMTRPWITSVKRLTDPTMTRGQVDLVILDSMRSISPGWSLGGRYTKDHMIRIESAVKYYKDKTGLPVVLLGHSNGGVSLANFVGYLKEKNESNLIAGIIESSTRHETYFPEKFNTPTLFVTHKYDGCRNIGQMNNVYENTKPSNSSITEWVLIEHGESEADHPCHSGYHMFNKAGQEYVNYMDEFIDKVIKE